MKQKTVSKYFSLQMFPDMGKCIALFEGSQVSPVCHCDKSNTKMKMSMERWWIDTDRENPKYSEENMFEYFFVYQKSHMD